MSSPENAAKYKAGVDILSDLIIESDDAQPAMIEEIEEIDEDALAQ